LVEVVNFFSAVTLVVEVTLKDRVNPKGREVSGFSFSFLAQFLTFSLLQESFLAFSRLQESFIAFSGLQERFLTFS